MDGDQGQPMIIRTTTRIARNTEGLPREFELTVEADVGRGDGCPFDRPRIVGCLDLGWGLEGIQPAPVPCDPPCLWSGLTTVEKEIAIDALSDAFETQQGKP